MFGLFKKTVANSEYEDIVKVYIELINKNPKLTDDELLSEMVKRNITASLAWELLGLFPIYVGRDFLQGMGIRFSETYTIVDSAGKTKHSGSINSHPFMQAIKKHANLLNKPEAFQSVALRGAELNAINNALNSGSEASNLVTASVTLLEYQA